MDKHVPVESLNRVEQSPVQPSELSPTMLGLTSYLVEIHGRFEGAATFQRLELGRDNTLCGPISYSIARLMQQQQPGLEVSATIEEEPEIKNGIYIVYGFHRVRYGIPFNSEDWLDHTWVEVVLGDQTLIVYPVASKRGFKVGYSAGVVFTDCRKDLYQELGIKRFDRQSALRFADPSELDILAQIVEQINSSEVPDMYSDFLKGIEVELSAQESPLSNAE